tara:strand:- start:1348 stop:1986 length:639 start_codon:yes stop_codon:yes gene_type:complete
MISDSQNILIVDYGMGNIGSIKNMLHYVGARAEVVSNPAQIKHASRIILPGVGHFDQAMLNLRKSGMAEALTEVVSHQSIPVLGICLGMQVMCNFSEEGKELGLGFIDASVSRFNFESCSDLKVPHMGWRDVVPQRGATLLGPIDAPLSRYYFVHSYYVSCENKEDVIGTTQYGGEFVSAFKRENVVGLQFHPEKSHKYGMQIFENFVKTSI